MRSPPWQPCFDIFFFLMPICNFTMDPWPKKQHLSCQFLMEVTRRKGLIWEANLAAHVSTILFLVFISFCVMCKANKASLQSGSETFHYGTISKQAISMSSTESSFWGHMHGDSMRTSSVRIEPHAWEGRYGFLTILTLLPWQQLFM